MYPSGNRKKIIGIADIFVVVSVIFVVWYFNHRVSDVLVYNWNWSSVTNYLVNKNEAGHWKVNILLEGLFTTIRISLWAMLLACFFGLIGGIIGSSKRLLARLLSASYIGVIRNIPPLVFIFVFYFFVSSQIIPILGIDVWARNLDPGTEQLIRIILGPPELIENLLSGIICLAMFEAAYIAEITRAGIQSIPKSQKEAAKSLGLNPFRSFLLVVLPQALRAILAPLASQFIMLIKNSAIISLISVQEMTFIGSELSISSGKRFEIWIVVAILYFILCYFLAFVFSRYEKRLQRRDL